MSLQGSIETFAIADVLRLLAATSKSGRLHVQGPARAGTVWVDSARVLAAESPSTPHVGGAVDIIFQLLRFERGSFRFELDKYPPNPGDPLDIELALGEAESMLQEWRELEQQIPGGDAWVQLRTAIDTPSVTLSAEEWITLVAVSGGRTVADIGDALESGELQTARAIARLLDLGLVEVGPRPAAASATPMLVATVTESEPVPALAPAEPLVGFAPPAPSAEAAPAPAAVEAKAAEPTSDGIVSNGATALVPPAPPAPPAPPVAPAWTPSDAAPGWAAPAEFPTLAPPPAAAPPPPAVDLTRADAGLVTPREADGFPTPPETDLDGNGASSFTYPAADASGDVFTYPPAPEAPPVWEPTKADAAPSNGAGDNGYPPLPPPLPPVYGSGTASPTLPPPPGASSTGNGTAAPPANGRTDSDAPSAKDGGWIGSLSEAIQQADSTGDSAVTGSSGPSAGDGGSGNSSASTTIGGAGGVGGTLAPGSFIGGGAVPPPPPAPPAPVGAWASPTSLFENGMPERLAPPPPPPPPPIATALQSMADPALVTPTLLGGPVALTDASPATETSVATESAEVDAAAGSAVDNAEDIERQLFNLSPRAREAVKQSSGLYDGRGRR